MKHSQLLVAMDVAIMVKKYIAEIILLKHQHKQIDVRHKITLKIFKLYRNLLLLAIVQNNVFRRLIMEKNTQVQTFRYTIRLTKYAFNTVFQKYKGKIYIFLKCIESLINSLFPIISIVLPGLIIDELTSQKRMSILIVYISILLITPFLVQIVNTILRICTAKYKLEINLSLERDFFAHLAKMDYSYLENPDIQTQKSRAQQALNNIIKIVDVSFDFFSGILSLFIVSYLIIKLNIFVVLLIVISILINSAITKHYNYKKHLLSQELSKYDRYQGAYTYMLEHFSYAKEIRLFNISDFLINKLIGSKNESNKFEVKFQQNNHIPNVFYALTQLVQQTILYMYLVMCVINNLISIGDMSIFLSATDRFSSSLKSVFNSYLSVSSICLTLQELEQFLKIPLKQQFGKKKVSYKPNSIIEFKNVSFKYPGCEKYALRNINISINYSEKLCIVGSNGSGKSTFIKLLTRLYEPTEGEILLNGVNINEYEYADYQKMFAAVFQDFVEYYMTLGENIALSEDFSKDTLNEVCKESGLLPLVNTLTHKYESQVGKWIDEEGFNPSGGENQRIAIARACYHKGDVFILDEPTSALDPIAEYEIYTQFNRMIKGKTAVLITHRLSAVQLADKVAVFEGGKLIEYGTHKELYESNGQYTEMFNKQSEFYKSE